MISNLSRKSRYHQTSQAASTSHHQVAQNNLLNDPTHDYQFYTEQSIIGAALNQMMSSNISNTAPNTTEESRASNNEGISIVSVPKNVKFLIPLGRSGMNSNESTFGLIESTTRTITHMKDVFPLTISTQSSSLMNDGENQTNLVSTSDVNLLEDISDPNSRSNQNLSNRKETENKPLLSHDDSNQK